MQGRGESSAPHVVQFFEFCEKRFEYDELMYASVIRNCGNLPCAGYVRAGWPRSITIQEAAIKCIWTLLLCKLDPRRVASRCSSERCSRPRHLHHCTRTRNLPAEIEPGLSTRLRCGAGLGNENYVVSLLRISTEDLLAREAKGLQYQTTTTHVFLLRFDISSMIRKSIGDLGMAPS